MVRIVLEFNESVLEIESPGSVVDRHHLRRVNADRIRGDLNPAQRVHQEMFAQTLPLRMAVHRQPPQVRHRHGISRQMLALVVGRSTNATAPAEME